MSTSLIGIILLGAALGGFVNGLAGFGTALFALPVWLAVLSPTQAVPVIAIMSVVSGAQSLWVVRKELSSGLPILPWLLLPAFVGLAFGTHLLSWISASMLKILIASLMISYGLFFACRRNLPSLKKSYRPGHIIAGFLGGLLGGAASLSGPIPTFWCSLQPWSKQQTSTVMRLFGVSILSVTAVSYTCMGYYSTHVLFIIAIAFPGTLLGSRLGLCLYKRLSDVMFKRLLVWLMLCSGLSVCAQMLL